MSKYKVDKINAKAGDEPVTVEADRAEHNEQTGAVAFYDEDDMLVARFFNVSFHKVS